MKNKSIRLTPRKLATVLAALRCYQQVLEQSGGDLPDDLEDIASDNGNLERLETGELDDLCEWINR